MSARVLAAEALRWRRSIPSRLVLLGAAAGVVSAAVQAFSGAPLTPARQSASLVLWVTGIGPVAAALLVATACRDDGRARGGGTWWRPTAVLRVRAARALVLAAFVLAMDALAVAVPMALLAPSSPHPPGLGHSATAVLVVWLGQTAVVALALRVAPRLGLLASLAAALAYLVAALATAEDSRWALLPPAWLLRGALPLLGTHANGLALAPNDPLAGTDPWAPALASLALAVVLVLAPAPRAACPTA